jgi:hypothetical protein
MIAKNQAEILGFVYLIAFLHYKLGAWTIVLARRDRVRYQYIEIVRQNRF